MFVFQRRRELRGSVQVQRPHLPGWRGSLDPPGHLPGQHHHRCHLCHHRHRHCRHQNRRHHHPLLHHHCLIIFEHLVWSFTIKIQIPILVPEIIAIRVMVIALLQIMTMI